MKEQRFNRSVTRRGVRRRRVVRKISNSLINYRLDPALKTKFNEIGVPENTAFKPDLFQLEALEKIKEYDVLVSSSLPVLGSLAKCRFWLTHRARRSMSRSTPYIDAPGLAINSDHSSGYPIR